MKKTLAMMSGIEARQHYHTLKRRRIERATEVCWIAAKTRNKKLLDFAENALNKAYKLGEPRQMWQLEAARERKERYGVGVAAGYMAANGWSVEAALHTLLGK